jgi:UDP-3-O-[3-hydroxymyristoyl] glucosamine N-acyltransferase
MSYFFENKGPFELDFLLTKTHFVKRNKYKNHKISNIATLEDAKKGDITFFDNLKYLEILNSSQASCVLIKENHLSHLKNTNIQSIISTDPLLDIIVIAKLFYPDSDTDNYEFSTSEKYKNFLEKNIVIDKNVEIGNNIKIGPNTTIKKNVKIGNDVIIGSNCSISNAIIEDNVIINDGSVIGKIGFGFKYINNKMTFIPHIGFVKIEKFVYIGSNCTIDRGSFSNTIIGSGTMLDNQVHIAHNCKVGKNCFIAGQVGIAGSSSIGNNCMIGGQAGISGHLTIGNNVYIGGGSGVIENVEDNKKIMGYPATDIKNFIKRK